jgi:hypothetical protein
MLRNKTNTSPSRRLVVQVAVAQVAVEQVAVAVEQVPGISPRRKSLWHDLRWEQAQELSRPRTSPTGSSATRWW